MGLLLAVVGAVIAAGLWAKKRMRDMDYLFDHSQEARQERARWGIKEKAIFFFGGGQPPGI
jgi:hypothetical protein